MINAKKLKIILSKDDMESLNFDGEAMEQGTSEAKRAFWEILDRAREKTGFETEGGRMLVTMFPSKDGGCEMFVNAEADEDVRRKNLKLSGIICRMREFENVISLCKKLYENKYTYKSALYYSKKPEYLLLLYYEYEENAFVEENNFMKHTLLASEYSLCEPITETKTAFIFEHCDEICVDLAVDKFSIMFK